ncbi:family 10 glycosylhydrolase [Paenibacillus sp. J5C_2022]|uniref:family 10 glycosylhydrolase n=1 Tax=Paenibacillus sp. J5C2022 TaxID=2977129 RepID=UPI0021D25AB7|nr:family 10 glycosylhydrolase [Paenibacillus sp. J5C2022]MCU6708704.1 family 10 glycosylhydrolase [Paenibacillus sp. J5C2022]
MQKVFKKGLLCLFIMAIIFPVGSHRWMTASANGSAVLIDDDASDLSGAGWTRSSDPVSGSYITDATNSLGNPANVSMKQVLRGQYLFYSSVDDTYNAIKKEVSIGSGRWYIEFEARMADLITPSENPVWNGFAIDTVANNKRYRVAFNSKSGHMDSTFKVQIMKNSSNDYEETIVHLDDFADVHKWGIEYDGGTTVSVILDGQLIARATGVNVASGYADQAMMYNSSTGLLSGTNEVYLYNYKLVKGSPLSYIENAIHDDAANLAAGGWAVSAVQTGQYITDYYQSPSNPNGVSLKPVSKGQYLMFGDQTSTASTPAAMSKPAAIGSGSWTLQLRARIVDLMQPLAKGDDTGLIVQVVADGKLYKLVFNDRDKVTAIKAASYKQAQANMPTDDQFHTWSIAHDGKGSIYVDLDNARVAVFDEIGSSTTANEGVTLSVAAQGSLSGTTEVYFDSIVLKNNTMPEWAKVQADAYSAEKSVHVLTDFTERLTDHDWMRSADPVNGNYITDFSASLGNPNLTPLLPVPQSQYLLYADASGTSSSITHSGIAIGSEPWMMELDMNIVDLITPSSNSATNGLSVDVHANSKKYKVTFNSMDTSGNIKLTVLKDGGGATEEKQIPLPPDGTFHQWGIGYDGASALTIILDGTVVMQVDYINVPDALSDRIVLHNNASDLQSGSNEVYLDLIKLEKENLPDWLFTAMEDDADNLDQAEWTRSNDPVAGNYITDEPNSLGNPNGIQMLPVSSGEYLLYSAQNGLHSHIAKEVPIGSGPWYAQLEARIADLPTPSANAAWRGLSVDLAADGKRYRLSFNSLDANGNMNIYLLKPGNTFEVKQVALPDDGFHTWGISYDGQAGIRVDLDGSVVAQFTYEEIAVSTPDGMKLFADTNNLGSGTTEVYVDKVRLLRNYEPELRQQSLSPIPDWVSAAVKDDADNLDQAGWTRSNDPVAGNYITDEPNSLGNPNDIQMLPVSAGEYLLYSAQNGLHSHIAKEVPIGSGPWYAQLEARIADLSTPSSNAAWRGLSVDLAADGKRYRLSFNSLDANGNMKIYLLKPGNTFEVKQVAMPNDGFHTWGISYDGQAGVRVDLDGSVVAQFTYEEIAVTTPDGMKLFADTNNLGSGTTEVYLDAIRLYRDYAPELRMVTLFDDTASSLQAANWIQATPPRTGVYMIDAPLSLGNPNGVPLKPVPAGQYLAYADGTSASGHYSNMKRNVAIGSDAWTLRFDAKIADLAKATNYYLWKGLVFNIYADNKRYMVSFNSYDADKHTIKAFVIGNSTNRFTEQEVHLPDDQAFHTWEIVYDGHGGLYLGLDRNLIAQSDDAGVSAASSDNIAIFNLANDVYTTGTNEVYIDRITLTKNQIPDWIEDYPHISGVTVKPEADSASVPVIVNIGGADSDWFSNPDVQVKAGLYNQSQLVTSSVYAVDAPTVRLALNGSGAGKRKLVVDLLNDGVLVDKVVKDIELLPTSASVAPEVSLASSPGAVYLFTEVDQMQNSVGQSAAAAGWMSVDYIYKGTDSTVTDNVYHLIESTPSAQTLTLPVDLYGWFGVYVGYADGTEQFDVSNGTSTSTISFGDVDGNSLYSEGTLREEFVTAANFNGRTLSFIPSPEHQSRIAYIKLRGLTGSDIAVYTTADEGALGKRVIYNNDGYTHFSSLKYHNASAIQDKALNLFDGQDVGGIDWALGTTMQLNYDSQYAGTPFQSFSEDDPTLREIDLFAKSAIHNIYEESGSWAPELLAQRAQDIGISFIASLRMNAFYSPTSFPALNGQMYQNYMAPPAENEARQLDAKSNPTYRLSFYYSHFRDYIKNILSEVAAIPNVDGVNLDFCRYPYVFGYELTDVNSRKAIVTQLLSEIRSALPGKTISVRIPHWNYEGYGLDPEAWIDQGLIDMLIPSNISYEDFFDISPFVNMTAGTNVKLYAGIVSDLSGTDLTKEQEAIIRNGGTVENTKRTLSRTQYQLRAYEVYEAGADGVYIFNDWWNGKGILGLLGDKVKVKKWHHFDYYSQLIENPVFIMHP